MIEMESLRGQTVAELVKQARTLKDELFHSRFAHATQQLKDPNKIRVMRRDIARVKTALTEKLQGHEHKAAEKSAKAKTVAAKPAKSAAPKAVKAEKKETAAKKPAAKAVKAKKTKE
jgi:large subunit ribosomal protein L29